MISKAQLDAIIERLRSKQTTLIAESRALGFTGNDRLRKALREKLGVEGYNELMGQGRRTTPETIGEAVGSLNETLDSLTALRLSEDGAGPVVRIKAVSALTASDLRRMAATIAEVGARDAAVMDSLPDDVGEKWSEYVSRNVARLRSVGDRIERDGLGSVDALPPQVAREEVLNVVMDWGVAIALTSAEDPYLKDKSSKPTKEESRE